MYRLDDQSEETAILVGVITPDRSRWEIEDNLDELEQLALTAGARVTERVMQNRTRVDPATYIGSGKVREIGRMAEEQQVDLVIFDDDLAPVQIRNLEEEIGCKLMDRSGLILDVFAGRASTSAAKTQVEVAQLEYLRSRLTRRWTHLSRQKGGIGTKGPGETQIETDRRLIDKRIATLKEKLERIDRQRQTQRKQRDQLNRVSLVGYTNAGKSTLMNALAEDTDVFAEDRLFATLDATTRKIQLDDKKPVLLSDTVGFIRKLPHNLIESFKSTLDEVRESDILIHVVDVTHPRYESQIEVVDQTLEELRADEKPTLMVFNKIDELDGKGIPPGLRDRYPHVSFVSAIRGIGMSGLKENLLQLVERNYVDVEVTIPAAEAETLAFLHRIGDVETKEYTVAAGNGDEAPTTAVAHLRVEVPRRFEAEVDRRVAPFDDLEPRSDVGDEFGAVSANGEPGVDG